MLWIILIIGAILGALFLDEEGVVPGLIVGYLFFQQIDLRKRVRAMQQTIDALAAPASEAVAEEPAAPLSAYVEPDSTEADRADVPESEAGERVAPEAAGAREEPAGGRLFRPSEPSRPSAPSLLDTALAALRQFFLGGNLVVRAGVVVLFFALSFLLKLAIDQNLFPIELRLAAIGLAGAALIGAGWRLKARRPGYGLSLQGGGLAMLYLTIYAAFKVYALIAAGPAFALLLVTALLGAAIAILQRAEGLAVIGFVGGFFAPVLASTGQGDHVMLFGFYTVLNIGLLVIAWFHPWRWLNRAGFYCTFGIAALWGAFSYRPELFGTTEVFLGLFFLIYFALSVLYATRQRDEQRSPIDGTLVFALPVVAFSLQAALVESFAYGLAWSSLALGAFYAGAAWVVFRRAPALLRMVVESYAGIALALLTMTIPFALDATWTGAGWALEGAALVWLGRRQGQLRVRLAGAALQLGAAFFLFAALDDLGLGLVADLRPVTNAMVTGMIAVSLSSFFTAYQFTRETPQSRGWERVFEPIFIVHALAWWYGAGLFELERTLTDRNALDALVVYAGLTALALQFAGERLQWRGLRLATLSQLPVLVVLLLPLAFTKHPLAHYGLAAWPIAYAALYAALKRNDTDLPHRVAQGYHAVSFWLLLLVVSWSAAVWLDDIAGAGSAWPMLGMMLPTLAGCLAALRAADAGIWPFGPRHRWYRTAITGIPLAVVWLLSLASIQLPADASPLPYAPILNPLDVALGLAAVTFAYGHRAATRVVPGLGQPPASRIFTWSLVGTVFVWITATLARTVHFWTGVSYDMTALWNSAMFQTVVSICWTLIAVVAMAWAQRRLNRGVWSVAAGLLALVVMKLFVVDLSALTITLKVVSFLVVGILLLVIGYIAPIPPHANTEDNAIDPLPDEPTHPSR